MIDVFSNLTFIMASNLCNPINILQRIGIRAIMTTAARTEKVINELKNNPYYGKYSEKLAKMQQTSPEEFLQRVDDHQKKPPENTSAQEPKRQFTELLKPKEVLPKKSEPQQKSLESIMKLELIKDKSASEIEDIWRKYHSDKPDSISACIQSNIYERILGLAKNFPIFLLALPRSQGYEFVMCQHHANTVHFTPLICYQVHKENAPECLTIHHFVDISDTKGIVLMKGEYDKSVVNANEALCLVNQLQLFYNPENAANVELLKKFTEKPLEFKHMDVIQQIEKLSL